MGKPRLPGPRRATAPRRGFPQFSSRFWCHEYKIVDIGPLWLGTLGRAQAWIEGAQ